MEMMQFEKAKVDFERCIILDPKAGELRRFLALSELGMNDISRACINLNLAKDLGDKGALILIDENCEK